MISFRENFKLRLDVVATPDDLASFDQYDNIFWYDVIKEQFHMEKAYASTVFYLEKNFDRMIIFNVVVIPIDGDDD